MGPEIIGGLAVVDLKYLANGFFYLYDRKARRMYEAKSLSVSGAVIKPDAGAALEHLFFRGTHHRYKQFPGVGTGERYLASARSRHSGHETPKDLHKGRVPWMGLHAKDKPGPCARFCQGRSQTDRGLITLHHGSDGLDLRIHEEEDLLELGSLCCDTA